VVISVTIVIAISIPVMMATVPRLHPNTSTQRYQCCHQQQSQQNNFLHYALLDPMV
jgi:hypothetical protein